LTYNNIKNKFKINNIILIPLTPAPLPQGERGNGNHKRRGGTETTKGEEERKPQKERRNGNHKGERDRSYKREGNSKTARGRDGNCKGERGAAEPQKERGDENCKGERGWQNRKRIWGQ